MVNKVATFKAAKLNRSKPNKKTHSFSYNMNKVETFSSSSSDDDVSSVRLEF
jgi:hypothetical protein